MKKLLKSGKYKFFSVKYPKYEQRYDEERIYSKYAERLRNIKDKGIPIEYPLKEDSRMFLESGYPSFELKNTIFLYISPERFLQLAFPKAHLNITSIDYLFDAFEYGEPKLDPVFLFVDSDLRVIQHEGRHRAEISKDLNIELIPIIIKFSYIYTDLSYDDIINYSDIVEDKGFDFNRFNKIQENIISLKDRHGRIIGKTILTKLLLPEKNPNLDRVSLIEDNKEKRKRYGIAKSFSFIKKKN